jgi:transposase
MNVYLGIDVSKGYGDFTLLDQNKKELEKVFQLDDTRLGHDALEALLEKHLKDQPISMVYCAVESTGGFENNWYAALIRMSSTMPIKVARLNPSGVKNNAAAGLNRNVTDALSSRYIAEYLMAHAEKVVYQEQSSYYASFRSLHKHIMRLKKQNTQLINGLKMELYSAFPEMMRYCKQGVPDWILGVLRKYPSASAIARLKVEQLVRITHVTQEKAESLIAKAKASVASRTHATNEFLIKNLAQEVLDKQELIEKHKSYLAKHCKGEEASLVDSVPGIAAYSAAAIMIEIEDVNRFASPKLMASYFGLHPALKQSGDKLAFRMSKKGRASMRATLYMCAQTAVLHDAHLKAIYHRHRSKGKNHKQAIGVIMHKLLRIIWGVLSSKQPYQSTVDEKNQNKKAVTSKTDGKKEEVDAKRRYQPLEMEAPISNKQTKKRKAHIKSQVECIEQVRDQKHAPVVNI